jgi:epoxyqueuosine reductase
VSAGAAESSEQLVKRLALEIGFDLVGIAGVGPHERSNRTYDRWLEQDRHGEMGWLERHRPGRSDPRRLLEGARSAVSVAVNYYHDVERSQRHMDGSDGRGAFSIYAQHRDYHEVLGEMLDTLAARVRGHFPGMSALACVDTKPVSDRAMAMRAGIAWLGKNTSVISPEFGSWIFLGELLTDIELTPDEPLQTLCGSCTRCIDACPTGALDTPFSLDARRCISYLTIEKRGDIAGEFAHRIGLDVYGCDTCQSVCPFNDVARESAVFDRGDRSPLVDMTVDQLQDLSDEEFRAATKGSAIRRCRPEGLRRNASIVKRNLSGGPLRRPAAPSED